MLTRTPRALILTSFASLVGLLLVLGGCARRAPTAPPADGYLFCFWNVENLFDDKDNNRTGADKEYDAWFAQNDADRKLKYAHLSDALVKLNGGRGPDILAVVEVESVRAAELLRDALNERLTDPALHYNQVLMKDLEAGRHIAPAIITRLPAKGNKTRLLGRQQRILEAHVTVDDHDLVIIASHWTSRVTDKTGEKRAKYGDQIYGAFKGMHKSNPKVDVLVCGDFNDTPDAPSVTQHLHAIGDRKKVESGGGGPWLYNLLADKDPNDGYGTHYYRKWLIFDQIAVSPAMLDGTGWTVVPDSVQTVNTLFRRGDRQKRPWRFGNPKDRLERGTSDHFPVTVRLKVPGG
jgi:endonuclease/exonuclease/phosphatase family metal-dependent hydrolase